MNCRATRLAALAVATTLSACGPQVVGPGGTVHLTFTAAPGLNPGPGGTPNPAQVRIYSLKARDKFLNADYFQLADKDHAVLGSDLLFRQDVTVRPGMSQTVDTTVLPGQGLLGIAVAYRDIDHATWRLAAPLVTPLAYRLETDRLVPAQ